MFRQVSLATLVRPLLFLAVLFVAMVLYLSERQNAIDRQVDSIIKSVEAMQESQQRLLDEQLQLSLDTNKTGLSISSHDNQIDVLEQYTKKYNLMFFGLAEEGADEDPEKLVRQLLVSKMEIDLKDKDIEYCERHEDGKSNPKPILVKFQRWKDKTRIFYKRKVLPAQFEIKEDLTIKQIHDNAKLEAYAKLAQKENKTIKWNGKTLFVNVYVPRKCNWTNRLVEAKDHSSVQINVANVDPVTGLATGDATPFCLVGYIRKISEGDMALTSLVSKSDAAMLGSEE